MSAPADEGPLIVAVIVAFESADVLPACLEALARESIPAILVDNASTDRSAEIARNHDAVTIVNPRNEGFGRGMNIGVRAATGFDHVLILNPDAVVKPGFAVAMRKAIAQYPDAGILGPSITGPDGSIFFPLRSVLSPYLQNDRKKPCVPEGDCCAPFLSGACYLIERRFFLDLGGFDPDIFLFYEDNDLCRRVADAGRSIVYVHDAKVAHAQGRSSSPAKGRRFKTRWHYAWSEGYIARKYDLPNPSYATFLRNALKYVATLVTGDLQKKERYGGAAAGALALIRGRTALESEGLERCGPDDDHGRDSSDKPPGDHRAGPDARLR